MAVSKATQEVFKSKKLVMDEETKRKMAGLLPCSSDFSITTVLDVHKDLPKEFQPKFSVTPYTSKQLKDVINKSQQLEGDALDTYANESVRNHVIGIANLVNISTGEVIEFTTDEGVCSKDLYESLPISVKTALMQLITSISSGLKV
jgi:hypothetical protein